VSKGYKFVTLALLLMGKGKKAKNGKVKIEKTKKEKAKK